MVGEMGIAEENALPLQTLRHVQIRKAEGGAATCNDYHWKRFIICNTSKVSHRTGFATRNPLILNLVVYLIRWATASLVKSVSVTSETRLTDSFEKKKK